MVREVNEAGGELLLDERVRRGGSHHQKLVLIRRARPEDDVAFVGGIDLCHGRRRRLAPPRRSAGGGAQPALRRTAALARPAARDPRPRGRRPRAHVPGALERSDPVRPPQPAPDRAPPDHRPAAPPRSAPARFARTRRPPGPPRSRCSAPIPRSVHRSRLRRRASGASAARTARRWAARVRLDLPRGPVPLVVARGTDARRRACAARRDSTSSRSSRASPSRAGPSPKRRRPSVVSASCRRSTPRVAIGSRSTTSRTRPGLPIYVHAKVCVVDDIWLEIGSDNLNRRSWTHDSELSCAVLDAELDDRAPHHPAGGPERARRLARETRLRLWREHLGRADGRRRRPRRSDFGVRGVPRRGRGARRVAPGRPARSTTARPGPAASTRPRPSRIRAGGPGPSTACSSIRTAGPATAVGRTRCSSSRRCPRGFDGRVLVGARRRVCAGPQTPVPRSPRGHEVRTTEEEASVERRAPRRQDAIGAVEAGPPRRREAVQAVREGG